VGIGLAILYAGGLPLLSVAGAHGSNPKLPFEYDQVIGSVGGFLASAMFLLFAVASIVPACFCAFIAGNSFATMIPGVKRMSSTMAGVTIAVVLAITGYAKNLPAVFGIVGASFGPICGAMVADYLLSGRKWAGPRKGVNWAGYCAWGLGFIVGLLPYPWAQPAVVYSFLTGFVVYAVIAKAGGEPETVEVREPVPMAPKTKRGRATATPE
jgi:cytosine permease